MIADRVNSAYSGYMISFKRRDFCALRQRALAPPRVGGVRVVHAVVGHASLGHKAELPFLFPKKIEIVLYFTFKAKLWKLIVIRLDVPKIVK